MNINRKKQSQFELFPGSSKPIIPHGNKIAPPTKDLTLSLENIIVLCIISIMVVVLFFSFGVEKGKKIAFDSKEANQTEISELEGSKKEGSERVVFPVNTSEDAQESQPAFRPPLEKTDEQDRLFTIQVASFKLEKNAQREAKRLKEGGHNEIFVMPKGSYSIVCVGKFTEKSEAQLFSDKIKARYQDFLIRRL